MRILSIVILVVFSSFHSLVFAQEVLHGMNRNPSINAALLKTHKPNDSNRKGGSSAILLPLIEDFSIPLLYPDEKIWATKSVFINRSYAVNPPSIGVATFDAMNDVGTVYPHMGSFPAGADTLTTQDIRLDTLFGIINQALSPADSVYLSFYVQPQGKGASPLPGDSLVLQFYNPSLNQWKSLWKIDGISLDSFRIHYDTSFLQVMIPITDTAYFKPNFRFRFYNYARVPSADKPSWRSGLYSHWNLDYILLNANRSYNDTSYNDLAIQSYQTSLLLDYQSMPWNQYAANPAHWTKYGLGIQFKNFDKIIGAKNVNQYFYVYDLWNQSVVIEPVINPSSLPVFSQEVINFFPDYLSKTFTTSAPQFPEFRVLFNIFTNTPPPDINKNNDTLAFYQTFYNYLSYDDGIPEAGYGLSTPNGRVAYQFDLSVDDTLRSIEMYFNQTLGNANQQYFFLTIWDNQNGLPGNVIYEQSGRRPEFESDLFQYHTYVLEEPIAVSGSFFIGWRQTTKDNLNIGFDFNNDQSEHVFYNVGGNWINSTYNGCLMMRPILGAQEYAHVGIDPKTINSKPFTEFSIYPNPNHSSLLHINFEKTTVETPTQINILSVQGQLISQMEFTSNIDISHLSNGVYILQITNREKGIMGNKKLIISR